MTDKALTQLIGQTELDALSQKAAASPRLRMNCNLHRSDKEACHRLLNAIEPGSYIRPHRHLGAGKEETLLLIRGKMGLVLFTETGGIEQTVLFTPLGDPRMVHIPLGQYHTWLSLQTGSIFFETKAGPYLPLSAAEMAPWAPAEGDASAMSYLSSLRERFVPGKD